MLPKVDVKEEHAFLKNNLSCSSAHLSVLSGLDGEYRLLVHIMIQITVNNGCETNLTCLLSSSITVF